MTRNRSLDEFLGGERTGPESDESTDDSRPEPVETDSEPEPDEPDEPAPDAVDDGDVEPAVSTYEFAPDGAACAACGAVVQRRWCDEAGLVCPDCKGW